MAKAKEHEYLSCVFCGKTALLDKLDQNSFKNWSVKWKVLQVRKSVGHPLMQKGGFPAIPEKSLDIIEMWRHQEYSKYVALIKARLLKIVKGYYDLGLISEEELEEVTKK